MFRNIRRILLLLVLLGLTACASVPEPKSEAAEPVKTLLGYTIVQARQDMSLTPDPYDISLSACYTESGQLIPELNQLRMRLQNDYSHRAGKQFIIQYNHRTLYPLKGN
jgi:hypothetical protein